MNWAPFDSETLIDVSINFVPLTIILFFVGVFAVMNPWGLHPIHSAMQFGVMLTMVVALVILSYVAARAIEGDATARRTDDE